MKKASLVIITFTLICCAFAGGFFLGRGTNHTAINVSAIPTATTTQTEPANTDSTEDAIQFPIDINTATAEQFNALPGIGETLANRILTYRTENGPFETLADLLNVEGIGEKKLEDILDYITIGGHA